MRRSAAKPEDRQPRGAIDDKLARVSSEALAVPRPGDWLEAHVSITRVGTRMAYGTCRLRVGERTIMTASGVFALMKPAVPKERSEG